jgi:hypothetical protein
VADKKNPFRRVLDPINDKLFRVLPDSIEPAARDFFGVTDVAAKAKAAKAAAAKAKAAKAAAAKAAAAKAAKAKADQDALAVKTQKPLSVKKETPTSRRTMTQTPNLRNMDTPTAIEVAKTEPHLIQDATGQYVGAPRGMMTPDDIAAMRAAFDADVAQGAEGADWYTRARASNVDLAGPDPARQRLLAQEQALWSAQANPDTNLNFAMQGHNAYEMGVPLEKVRTGQQARTYNTARDAGVDIPLGKKTGIYGMHLDPTSPYATTGTNDIWHARGFGYKDNDGGMFSRALSDQEHRFLDYETMLAVERANANKLAGRDDWLAHEIQAAPWVAGKGRGLAQNIAGAGNEVSPAQLDEGLRRAGMTYPDYLDKYTANATYEQVPYSTSGHLEGIGAGDEAIRREYSQQPGLSWTGNSDRDMLYDALGAYQSPTIGATGVYTPPGKSLETNVAFNAQPLVGLTEGGVDPASRGMLDFAETLRGYLGAQGASAWHKTLTNVPAGQQGSVLIPAEGPVPAETLVKLGALGGKYGVPDFVDTGKGVTMTNFDPEVGPPSGTVTGRNLRGDFGGGIQEIMSSDPLRVKVDSSYIPILEAGSDAGQGVAGSGYATDKLLSMADKYPIAAKKLESGNIQARAMRQADLDEVYAERGFGATREDIQTARRIFSERGFEGLREARRQGVALPGIAALLSLYGLEGGEETDGAGGF